MRSLSLKLLEMSLQKIGTQTIKQRSLKDFTNLNNCKPGVVRFDDNLNAKDRYAEHFSRDYLIHIARIRGACLLRAFVLRITQSEGCTNALDPFRFGRRAIVGIVRTCVAPGASCVGQSNARAAVCRRAYFLIGVLVPVANLSYQGQLQGFTLKGSLAATAGGVLGALGAICIIFAFRYGGVPAYVMPLVFAGAPLVNVLFSTLLHPPKTAPNPMLYLGFLMAAAGAGMVLYFKPQS